MQRIFWINVCAKTLLLQYVPYVCYNKDLFRSYNILMYLFINSFICCLFQCLIPHLKWFLICNFCNSFCRLLISNCRKAVFETFKLRCMCIFSKLNYCFNYIFDNSGVDEQKTKQNIHSNISKIFWFAFLQHIVKSCARRIFFLKGLQQEINTSDHTKQKNNTITPLHVWYNANWIKCNIIKEQLLIKRNKTRNDVLESSMRDLKLWFQQTFLALFCAIAYVNLIDLFPGLPGGLGCLSSSLMVINAVPQNIDVILLPL